MSFLNLFIRNLKSFQIVLLLPCGSIVGKRDLHLIDVYKTSHGRQNGVYFSKKKKKMIRKHKLNTQKKKIKIQQHLRGIKCQVIFVL